MKRQKIGGAAGDEALRRATLAGYAVTIGGTTTSVAAVFLGVFMAQTLIEIYELERLGVLPAWLTWSVFTIGSIFIVYCATGTLRTLANTYSRGLEKLLRGLDEPIRIPKLYPCLLLIIYVFCFVFWPWLSYHILTPFGLAGIAIWLGWFITLKYWLTEQRTYLVPP